MNRLSRLLGTDKFLGALTSFYNRFEIESHGPIGSYIYPTSLDLMNELQTVAPDSVQPIIHDLFQTVTLYDNRIISAETESVESGPYSTTVTYSLKKMTNGRAVEPHHGEWIQFALTDSSGIIEDIRYLPFRFGRHQATFQTCYRPVEIVLDPEYFFIDRIKTDQAVEL
jgi:hypothetical protein